MKAILYFILWLFSVVFLAFWLNAPEENHSFIAILGGFAMTASMTFVIYIHCKEKPSKEHQE